MGQTLWVPERQQGAGEMKAGGPWSTQATQGDSLEITDSTITV